MTTEKSHRSSSKPLTIFKLVLMAVLAIDSLKNLPANAQYGSGLLFFYLIATITFFIPSALVAAELATAWSETGGVYIWVREAFGKRAAFVAAWTQWLYQLIWYPTILSFIAVTLAYFVSPTLGENKIFVLAIILSLFWLATFLICMGIKISSHISSWSALIGVIIPMLAITFLGLYWLLTGNHSHLHFSLQSSVTNIFSTDNLRLFITLLFSLMGMELIAVHAGDVKNPKRDYPRVLIISALIVLATVIPSSLAIAMVISPHQISLTTGVIEAFTIFLNVFHLAWMKPLVIISVAVGSFGIFLVWLLSSTRCLLIAAKDDCLPHFFQKTNQKNMPVNLLLIQGIIFSLLCITFILMPSVNSAFWLLTASSSQLALIYYIFLFSAAIWLRYKRPEVPRPFRVGKHPMTLWFVCGLAIVTCLIAIGFGFLPPSDLSHGNTFYYELTLISLMLLGCSSAVFIYEFSQSKKNSLCPTPIPSIFQE